MARRRPLVGGNWKMHGDLASSVELTENLIAVCDGDVLEKVPGRPLYRANQSGNVEGSWCFHGPGGAF